MIKRRVNHCGDGPAAIETEEYNGTRLYCFRCSTTTWTPKEPELRRPVEEVQIHRGPPPRRGVQWPTEYKAWMAGMGFGRYECGAVFDCYWADCARRLVFVFNDGFWTARTLERGRVKWLGASVGRDKAVIEYGKQDDGLPSLPVVLTEDFLSAAKIGLAMEGAVTAIPCLGTIPSAAVLSRAAMAPFVVAWMDPDAAGQRSAQVIRNKLGAVGVKVDLMPVNGTWDSDPKFQDPHTIYRRLSPLLT